MSIRKLGKQSLIYGFGHILSRIITFLLLPLYTNVFSPEDYGVISLIYAFMGFALMIYRYGTDTALMKFYSDEEFDNTKYFTSIFSMVVVSGIVFSGVLFLASPVLSSVLIGSQDHTLLKLVSGILFFDSLWTMATIILRSEERPFSYVSINLINVIGTLGLNIYFVVGLRLGLLGVLYSNLIVSAGLTLFLVPFFYKRYVSTQLSKSVVRSVLVFALPFLPAGIFTMILELSNRYFLNWLTDTHTVGIYSAGYKLGMFGLLMVMGFNMGWTPYFLKEKNNPDAKNLFSRVATYFLGVQGLVTVILVLWIDNLIRFSFMGVTFFGVQYWESTQIMPVILLGYMFFALYVLQHPSIYHTNNTRWVAMFRGVGAAVAVILNLVLIPLFGYMGSAWASVIAYASMSLFLFLKTRNIYTIPYRFTGVFFPFIAVVLISFLPLSSTVKWIIPIVYVVIWYFLALDKTDQQKLTSLVRK